MNGDYLCRLVHGLVGVEAGLLVDVAALLLLLVHSLLRHHYLGFERDFITKKPYRETHLLVNLSRVYFDFGCSTL